MSKIALFKKVKENVGVNLKEPFGHFFMLTKESLHMNIQCKASLPFVC